MAITIKHAKTDTIADWTQADLDQQIAAGNYPPGTTLANIVLPSDWNNDHTVTGLGTIATQDANAVAITGGTINDTSQSHTTITDYESFTPTTAPSYAEGRVWYDSTEKALAFYNDSSALAVHVSQDLIFKVINNTGSTIANGTPVYVTGTSSGQTYPNVALAKADIAATSAVIGLTNGAIANGAIGYVTSQGTIDNVNTSTFTVGQVLYLSPYSAGQLMNTIPPTGITVQVGVVTFVNSSTGHIYVKQTTPLAVPASIITGQVAIANGGTGASTASGARTNLGLGTIATQDANAVAITGGAIDGTTIGATTASTGKFTTLQSTGNTLLNTTSGTTSIADTSTVGQFGVKLAPNFAAGSSWDSKVSLFGNVNLATGAGSGAFGVAFDTTQGTSLMSIAPAVAWYNTRYLANTHQFLGLGFEQFRVTPTNSAVNYVQVTGAATGQPTAISAQGSDSNIRMNLFSKGTESVDILTNGGAVRQARFANTTSSVNWTQITGSIAGNAVPFSIAGSDTNISMAFQPKGTGAIDLAAGSSGVNISNGGTVTAVTRTAAGTGYTSPPTVNITAPTTAGGVQATATCGLGLVGVAITSGGTGYTLGDVLTVVGGTFSIQQTFTVTGVSAGVITLVSGNGASYSVLPANPVTLTGGTGTGASFTITWGLAANNIFTITNAGSGYIEQPTVTFSGGGGSGASAYATVGSPPVVKGLGASMQFQTPGGIQFGIVDSAATSTAYWQSAGGAGTADLRTNSGSTSGAYISNGAASNIVFRTNINVSAANQLIVSHTASAVNYVQVTGSATGGNPTISVQGSDANAGFIVASKGTGLIRFDTGTTTQFRILNTNTAVNRIDVTGSAAGTAPSFACSGSDTNIDLALTPKGTGVVQFGSYTATVTAVAGYIQIKDAGGTVRKLAVLT